MKHTNANARYYTGTAHPCNVIGRSLESGTKKSPHASENNGFDTSTAVGERTGKKSSNQCPAIIDCYYTALSCSISLVVWECMSAECIFPDTD